MSEKKPWTPADFAWVGLSAVTCGLVVFGTLLLIVGPLDYSLKGAPEITLIVIGWVCIAFGVGSLALAAWAKMIQIGVRSARED